MLRFFSFFLLTGLLTISCQPKVNTYENDLGIAPSVVAQIDTANYTRIQWLDTLVNFGNVAEGDSVLVKFRFRNDGKTALFITEVLPSCGCTVADYPREPILPGKSGELSATFNSLGHPGFISKTVTVTTNTSNGINHVLTFFGEVKKR